MTSSKSTRPSHQNTLSKLNIWTSSEVLNQPLLYTHFSKPESIANPQSQLTGDLFGSSQQHMLKHQYTHWTLLMSLELRFGKQTNQLFKCRETDRVIPWRTLPTQQTWLYKENIPIRNDTPKIKMAAEQIKRNFRLFSISYFVDMNSHQLYNLICICTAETNNWKRKKKKANKPSALWQCS